MTSSRILLALLLAATLAACEQKPYQPPVPHAGEDKPESRLLDPQRQTLDQAKGVESTIQQGVQKQEEAADKQTK